MIINGTIEISLPLSECMSIDLMRDNSVTDTVLPCSKLYIFYIFWNYNITKFVI